MSIPVLLLGLFENYIGGRVKKKLI
jgi:hypothetical protein